jgi:hypothetical protein
MASFLVLVGLWQMLLAATVALGVILNFQIKSKPLRNFLTRLLKVFMTLQTSIFFIPIVDSYTFALRCTLGGLSDSCLGLNENAGIGFAFICVYLLYLIEVVTIALLYYDSCFVCGGIAAKPHPRFKLLRYFIYIMVISMFYFLDITGKVEIFLTSCFILGIIGSYAHCQYVPYFNYRIAALRLGTFVTFTSAVFCLLAGEFFKGTDQTNSSVSMLFYFLTPCIVQIMQLAMVRRGKILREKKMTNITSPYQVEIKVRSMLVELENIKNKKRRSIYGTADEEENDDEEKQKEREMYEEIEQVWADAFKKFPNSEFLYLWSGLFQIHFCSNFILAMV